MAIYLGTEKRRLNINESIVLPLVHRIPSEYKTVKCIVAERNVGAYIDLGFAFDTKARIEMSQYIYDSATTSYPFGAVENSGATRCCLSSPYSGYSYCYGSSSSSYISTGTDFSTIEMNKFRLVYGDGYIDIANLSLDKSAKNKTQSSYTMSSNLYLFAQNYNGAPRFGGRRQIGYFKYYDKNNELICDLVPCYRKNDGEVGMYDTVRRIFLTNVGTGSFKAIDYESFKYTNQVLTSINTDGSIYNDGLGYKVGYRVRSGGDETTCDNCICTGFIPFRKGDTIYIFPKFTGGNTDNTINFADENFTNLGQITSSGAGYGICTDDDPIYSSIEINGFTTLTFTNDFDSRIAYIRVTNNKARCSNYSNFIITRNEEII